MAETPKQLTKNELAYQQLVQEYGQATVARFAGVTRQAVTKWDVVPFPRVAAIADATGLPPEAIRPEPYAVP